MHRLAEKLSWEIVALHDRGTDDSAGARALLAAEIAYGVALQVGDQPELFSAFMSSIIGQVSDNDMQQELRRYEVKGLQK